MPRVLTFAAAGLAVCLLNRWPTPIPTLDGQMEVDSVPEPATLGLLGMAWLGLGARRRRAAGPV